MKIGLVRRGYSPTGGAEAYLLRLAAELSRSGHDLVLYSDMAWPDAALEGLSLTQSRIEARDPLAFAREVQANLGASPCDFVLSLERILACDAYRAGDGVHAAWLERRVRFESRWKGLFRHLNRKHASIMELENALLREGGARQVIVNSQMVKREIMERFTFPEDRISIVYNGLPWAPADPDSRQATRAELGLQPEEYVAIFVGSGWERKGLQFAVEAVRQTPGVTLLVAGKGRARPEPNVRFIGPRNDVPRLLTAADVFILPTIYDPFSNASLEALAAGLPVITTWANGCAEILRDGVDGTVVSEPDDLAALAAALQHWSDPVRRDQTRPARIAHASTFTIERNVRETLEIVMQRVDL